MNVRRLTAFLLTLAFALPVTASADTPTVTYEAQAWWLRSGIVVPSAVGSHIHVKATVPADGAIVDGQVTIPVRVTLHNARGRTNWLRIGTESTQLYSTPLALGPCAAECAADISATIDLSRIPTGRHELRISANVPDEDPDLTGSQRFFPTWNGQICVRSCTPTYRAAGPVLEARSWYTNAPYQNVSLRSAVRSGGTINVRMGPGSGGRRTLYAGVYIDPDFHNGSAGTVVREWSGPFTGSVTLPTLSAGAHRLVILSSDGQNAGVLAVPFIVP